MKKVTIIGGGPAALMLASELDARKYQITLCERKKGVGRKFLVAGEGGLNLTFDAPVEDLISQYVPSDFMAPVLRQFTNDDLMGWLNAHGIPTFTGSSNRVFPDLDLKPIEVLNKIVEHIATKKIDVQLDTEWTGWDDDGRLTFTTNHVHEADIVVFALGGASWKVTGSDGKWSTAFEKRGIRVQPFRAANCAFGVAWNLNFLNTHQGKPLKNIALSYKDHFAKGELVISKFGLEGNALYGLSQQIQDTLRTEQSTIVFLDLKPTMTLEQIKDKMKQSSLTKMTDLLKKDLNLDSTSIGLLKQFTDKATFLDPHLLAKTIKAVPVRIQAADEIDNAISTLGGIDLNEIDHNFELKQLPNTFVLGEMLDWYAPTGGYLLQGCFSMGFVLAKFLNNLEEINAK